MLSLKTLFLLAPAALTVAATDFWIVHNLEGDSYCAGNGGCTGGSNEYIFLSNGDTDPGCVQFDSARPEDGFDPTIKWPDHFQEILCNTKLDFYNITNGADTYDFYVAGGNGQKLGRCYRHDGPEQYCTGFGGSSAIRGSAQCFYDGGVSRIC